MILSRLTAIALLLCLSLCALAEPSFCLDGWLTWDITAKEAEERLGGHTIREEFEAVPGEMITGLERDDTEMLGYPCRSVFLLFHNGRAAMAVCIFDREALGGDVEGLMTKLKAVWGESLPNDTYNGLYDYILDMEPGFDRLGSWRLADGSSILVYGEEAEDGTDLCTIQVENREAMNALNEVLAGTQ